jgi:CHAT domain-containing protein
MPRNIDASPVDPSDTVHAKLFFKDEELEREINTLGHSTGLDAIILKQEATQVISFASEVILLPSPYRWSWINNCFNEETLGLGLRQTVQLLRPHGPSLMLGESLLSLARASRMTEPLETRLEWILEGLRAFRAMKSRHRMGRGYIDLAINLKDGEDYYDALYAVDEAERLCADSNDEGGVAAARYHRAHIYRMIGQPLEALRGLALALDSLPNGENANLWRNQIRSERIFNNLTLERFDDALQDIDAWIASGEEHYFPFFYRGEIFERRGNLRDALRDYSVAVIHLAQNILKNQSDRFRRINASANRFRFERALRVALDLGEKDSVLSLLEMMNTGGRAIQAQQTLKSSLNNSEGELDHIRNAVAELKTDALKVLMSGKAYAPELVACQDRADLLLANRDLLGASPSPVSRKDCNDEGEADELETIRSQIIQLLPQDAVLLEYVTIGDELWIVAATSETTLFHCTTLGRFGLQMLKTSFIYECEGLLESVSLQLLQRELLAPVYHLLSEKGRVVITLAEDAYGIPFHAMQWTGGFLIDTHDVQYIVGGITVNPGVQASAICSGSTWAVRFLGAPTVSYVAVDRLQGVETECRVVKQLKLAKEVQVTLPATSEDLFRDDHCSILHIACHGIFEERAPLLSRLLFEDRPVFAFEIAMSTLRSDIAIITGCQTATALSAAGGYVQSLAAAFQQAGVRTVIASLWPIDDEASAVLINKLYEFLCNDPDLSSLSAFCKAQRYLCAQGEFQHPYYWAPFLIFENLVA